MSLYYLSTINQYLGHRDIYSPQELIESDRLEKIWKESLPKYSIHQLLEIFPTAKPIVKRNLLAEIKQYKADLSFAEEWKEKFYNKIIYRVSFANRWFYVWLRDWIIEDLIEGKEEKIKKNYFLLSALKDGKDTGNPGKITESDIARAKEFPLSHFLKINSAGFARCPFHNERTGSLKVYPNNRWWCYGCSIGGDVVDLVMRQQNITFVQAVKQLINK